MSGRHRKFASLDDAAQYRKENEKKRRVLFWIAMAQSFLHGAANIQRQNVQGQAQEDGNGEG